MRFYSLSKERKKNLPNHCYPLLTHKNEGMLI